MNALIIEDESLAADRLIRMLSKENEDINVMAVLDTVEKSVAWLRENPGPDVIFLDIELGDGKSFDVFEEVPVNAHIIFITAFDEYAVRAFKYNSIDYLLKPLKKADLSVALGKFRQYYSLAGGEIDMSVIVQALRRKEYKSRFLVAAGSRLYSVNVGEVAFIYTRERQHYLKTFTGHDYLIDNNLDELEMQLDPACFFRVNRQFIIHHPAIDQVFAWFDGKIKLQVQPMAYEDIIISRLRAADFKRWLGK
ncbi:MAG: response regulator transcription factor [Chitinophaga sp.]|uniref:LytR/AlgR family response regulator transcription factor n=1 Tax=Chitinophaga sp. TaxID=1869181 RepID=UPI001B1A46DC|nr:LytTR family DNA-binding domain-containing protein [Chitinophaga sp.]MBO9731547.1 response regulator transcription factor [Chitinophaga sp.]